MRDAMKVTPLPSVGVVVVVVALLLTTCSSNASASAQLAPPAPMRRSSATIHDGDVNATNVPAGAFVYTQTNQDAQTKRNKASKTPVRLRPIAARAHPTQRSHSLVRRTTTTTMLRHQLRSVSCLVPTTMAFCYCRCQIRSTASSQSPACRPTTRQCRRHRQHRCHRSNRQS